MATHPHEPPVAAVEPPPEADDGAQRGEDWEGRYTRLAADLQNVRRRAERERAELMRFGGEPLSRSLLPVLDNLQRALEAASEEDPLTEGLRQVIRQFEEVLAAHGVRAVDAVGQRFDPAHHEAVLTEPNEELEDDTVTGELRRGYRLHDRVLRPAQVRVSRRPS
jgi:molecular chaperone GrpE